MNTPQLPADPDFDQPTASALRSGDMTRSGIGLREVVALMHPRSAFVAGVVASVFLVTTIGFVLLLSLALR